MGHEWIAGTREWIAGTCEWTAGTCEWHNKNGATVNAQHHVTAATKHGHGHGNEDVHKHAEP
eukprot:367113-Ditylum_brightwellii.AAC.1